MPDPALPALPYSDWKQTKQTLHLFTQIVGTIELAATPPRNHWWNIALHLDVRGLTTRRLTLDGMSFDLSFDFLDHRLILRTDAAPPLRSRWRTALLSRHSLRTCTSCSASKAST